MLHSHVGVVLVGFWLFDFLIVDASIHPRMSSWLSCLWGVGVCAADDVLFRIELIVLCVLLIGLFHKSATGD